MQRWQNKVADELDTVLVGTPRAAGATKRKTVRELYDEADSQAGTVGQVHEDMTLRDLAYWHCDYLWSIEPAPVSKSSREWREGHASAGMVQVSDGVCTFSTIKDAPLEQLARDYAAGYDHNGEPGWVVCRMKGSNREHLVDFAFDERGGFEYPTKREYLAK